MRSISDEALAGLCPQKLTPRNLMHLLQYKIKGGFYFSKNMSIIHSLRNRKLQVISKNISIVHPLRNRKLQSICKNISIIHPLRNRKLQSISKNMSIIHSLRNRRPFFYLFFYLTFFSC